MTNTTATVNKQESGDILISASILEDFLNEVIEYSKQGYKVVEGSTVGYSIVKSTIMTLKEEKPVEELTEAPVEVIEEEPQVKVEGVPEDVVEEATNEAETATGIDADLIKTFNGDKNKLEDYGKTFGIDLKKSRSFKNMLKDLEEYVEG